jgi:hypothetical protein
MQAAHLRYELHLVRGYRAETEAVSILRNGTVLEALEAELARLVEEEMLPAHVSMWLPPREAQGDSKSRVSQKFS